MTDGTDLTIPTLVGAVVFLTVLFDLVDLRPQVGSFRFVPTGTYLVYLFTRLVIALAAAGLIAADRPTLSPLLVAFVAVLGGVVVLQGLVLNIAGTEVASPAKLIATYKNGMVAQEQLRYRRAREAEILRTTDRLHRHISDERELRHACLIVLFQVYQVYQSPTREAEHKKVRELLDGLEQPYQDDPSFKRRIYASIIAESNPAYAQQLLARVSEPAGGTGT